MQRSAFGARGIAHADAGEEIGLALDRGGGGVLGQVGDGRGSAEIVGKRHDRPAVQDAEPVAELLAHRELGRDALARHVDNPHAEELGKWRLRHGADVVRLVVRLARGLRVHAIGSGCSARLAVTARRRVGKTARLCRISFSAPPAAAARSAARCRCR